jgi:putative aminopeptidase FrvX
LLLKELSEAFGVSGNEEAVRQLILDAVKERIDEHRVDALGNLVALKRGKGKGRTKRKVMMAAHMDEVGLMIVLVEKEGSLRFRPVGGIDPRVLLAKKVVIGKDRVPGVIGVKPIHLLETKDIHKVMPVQELSIDIGASDEDEAKRLVKVGDYAAFDVPFVELGGAWRAVKGKAFDDRAGCAVLIELLREEYPFDLYAVFTVQEEVGLRGARVAAYSVAPDLAFALEGTICDDLPKEKDVSPTTRLGAGPAITVMDRSVIADHRLVQLLVDTAEQNSIPYQFKQPGLGGTDAGAIHLSREGVPSVAVAVPARNIHAPVSLLSLNDVDNTVRLMRQALAQVPELELSY